MVTVPPRKLCRQVCLFFQLLEFFSIFHFCYCSTSSTLFSNLPIVTHFHKGTIYKRSSVVFLAFHLVLFMDGQILSKDMNVNCFFLSFLLLDGFDVFRMKCCAYVQVIGWLFKFQNGVLLRCLWVWVRLAG